MALMLIPLLGMIGFATEGGNLYLAKRALQNAADSAVLAAATNNCKAAGCGPLYSQEAIAVAARYGFVNGASNVTVTSAANVACPSGGTTCYRVTITKPMPFSLMKIVKFTGDAGAKGQNVSASSLARPRTGGTNYCIIALASGIASGTDAFTINGGPKVDLTGCSVFSNASSKCNGNGTWGIVNSGAVGTANGCGANNVGGQAAIADPFSALASNISANSCGTAGTTNISGAVNWSAYTAASPLKICGDLKLTANVTVTAASPGSVVIIEKGNLVLNGKTLTGPTTAGITFVFSGLNTTTAGFATGSGTLDFGAPKSGVWSGVAMYQNPNLTTTQNISYSGSSPTFNITGLLYAPYATVTISGAINKQTAGLTCIGLIARSLTLNGNGSFFANSTSECGEAGLTLPTVAGTGAREGLVQ